MRRYLSLLSIASAIAATVSPASARPFTDGQHVQIRGVVRAFDGITAKDGTRYVIFAFNGFTVLAKGRPDLWEGDQITVRGTYHDSYPVVFPKGSWRGVFGVSNLHKHRIEDVIVAEPASL